MIIIQTIYSPRRTFSRAIISFILVSVLVLSTAVQAFAADESQAGTSTTLDEKSAAKFLDDFFASEGTQPYYKGASVVVVKDGEVIAQEGYGYANVEEELEVDPESTVFRAASVSKTFVAVAIMQLAEDGKLDLNEDIRTYMPDIEFENPYETPVTVAHLLTHQSGFEVRDPDINDMHTDFERYVSIEEYVNQRMPSVIREPGSAYLYDNFAYLLLGLVVQNVSEQPFEQYMDEHVFEPLNMRNSGFILKGKLLEQLATGYDEADQPLEPYTYIPTAMPEGGMLTTAEDMGRFMIAFLNEGTFGSKQLLSEQSVVAMSEYRSSIHPLLPNTTYGFEAATQLPLAGSSEQILTKLGDLPGNSSMLLFIPEEEVGVFLTYNKQGILRELFYGQFVATFFPEFTEPAELEEFQPSNAEQLAELAGIYSDLRLSAITTQVEVAGDGSLTIADAYLGPRNLTQVDDYLFIDELTRRYTAFTVDEHNDTVYMKEPYLNPLGYARKGDTPVGFTDVEESNPHSPHILALQSLGHYTNEEGEAFKPEQPVSRAELAYYLVTISGLKPSSADSYAFPDIDLHPLADYIQTAHDLGFVSGNQDGLFEPERPATRQEAAVMVWNVYRQLYPSELFSNTALSGETADWAVPAVQMMITLGVHGPEVTWNEDGAADYRSSDLLNRQEAASFYYKLLTQPTDQIVAGLMQQQQQDGGSVEEVSAPEALEGQPDVSEEQSGTEE